MGDQFSDEVCDKFFEETVTGTPYLADIFSKSYSDTKYKIEDVDALIAKNTKARRNHDHALQGKYYFIRATRLIPVLKQTATLHYALRSEFHFGVSFSTPAAKLKFAALITALLFPALAIVAIPHSPVQQK